jgi:arginine utilization protein RocB
MTAVWGTPSELKELLLELVSWESVTLSEGEREFPVRLEKKLRQLDYFRKHPENLALHQADLGRQFLTALYKHPEAKQTICLISHFDTVDVQEYGQLRNLATRPEELTEAFRKRAAEFSEDVQNDLESGDYLFGRGTMDMKMGLATHMHLLEKASLEAWPVNLLLLTVPDEEVNSAGMRAAVPVLLELKEEKNLEYMLFLNGEPVFTNQTASEQHLIYTGTMGKVMPAALFYGKETHAGEPLKGMTSPFIGSYLTREMEWNVEFQETSHGEKTPLPVTLQQRDLKYDYSTQTPHRSVALYNVMLLEKTAEEVFHAFERKANKAAAALNRDYQAICKANQVSPIGDVKVIRYEALYTYAEKKLGESFLARARNEVQMVDEWDEREKSFRLADKLIAECQELAPAMIILLAPPYYPAVNSSGNDLVEACVDFVKAAGKEHGMDVERVHYFNGISDLSYVSYNGKMSDWETFEKNTPVWNDSYTIPFAEMKELDAPVLNIGPYGKDAHQLTERLHLRNALEVVPDLLAGMINMLCKQS